MIMWGRRGENLLLSVSPEGVHFLREQWTWLRALVRWQLATCSADPLAELTGLPVPTGPVEGRLAYVVDYWCGRAETGPVRRVWEGWVLHDLERALVRVLDALPRRGGVVALPAGGQLTAEWGLMLETLHVVLDVSSRVSRPAHPERVLPPRPCAEDVENYRASLRWLEMVLDTLAQAERTAPASATD